MERLRLSASETRESIPAAAARTHLEAQFRFAKADNARLALDLIEPIAAQCSQPVFFVGIRDAVDFGI
jgi:hypothetical protein